MAGTLSGLALLLHGQELTAQKPAAIAGGAEPVLDEINRQLFASLNDMERAPAAAARRHADALRMLAAYGAKEGYDTLFGDRLRSVVRTQGRQALILERPDLASLTSAYVKELARQGIRVNVTDRFARQLPLDVAMKEKALDDLLARGVTATWRRHAATLHAVASDLEPFRPARQTKAEQLCDELNGQLYQFEILVGIACIFGGLIACGTTTASYLLWKGYVGSTYNCW
ncbi:MAG TPA: hypothetical protein VNJ02_15320 [Vicinamibacterales bacterium]|nr:hypothetical protein [Vicinamibacterales bacterium]